MLEKSDFYDFKLFGNEFKFLKKELHDLGSIPASKNSLYFRMKFSFATFLAGLLIF